MGYGFEFKSRPELQCRGVTKEQARKLSEACRRNNIRLIPLFNCLMAALKQGSAAPGKHKTAEEVAATIRAAVKEWDKPAR